MRLDARDVSRRYRDGAGLQAMSVSVSDGEFVALVGPSGVGKTTLLSILGGLMSPDTGVVELDGRSVARCELMANVAWVPQGSNALPSRSVVENVMLGALSRGHAPDKARFAALDALRTLGLRERADFMAREVSGGELQRLALARALCSQRSFVLADEPTGNLDPVSTAAVIDAIVAMRDRRWTVVVATHDRAVSDRADRVVELGHG